MESLIKTEKDGINQARASMDQQHAAARRFIFLFKAFMPLMVSESPQPRQGSFLLSPLRHPLGE
jgi:hypothetical protein